MSSRWRARSAGSRSSTTRSARPAASRDAGAARPHRFRRDRPAGRVQSTSAGASSTCLVGNAGMLGGLSPLGHLEPKNFERVFDVNVTANWRFIRSLDPLLRASRRGAGHLHQLGLGRIRARPSGAPMRRPRRRWRRWRGSMPRRARRPASAASSSIRRVARTAMRALAMPGEDPQRCRTRPRWPKRWCRLQQPMAMSAMATSTASRPRPGWSRSGPPEARSTSSKLGSPARPVRHLLSGGPVPRCISAKWAGGA